MEKRIRLPWCFEFHTYRAPNRFFNLLTGVITYQGDGCRYVCLVLFGRGLKIEKWFNNDRGQVKDFDWRLFKRSN